MVRGVGFLLKDAKRGSLICSLTLLKALKLLCVLLSRLPVNRTVEFVLEGAHVAHDALSKNGAFLALKLLPNVVLSLLIVQRAHIGLD